MRDRNQATWQFMSIHCLEHPWAPVEIPHELEAFVHVLLYGALRFLQHNLDTIRDFVARYFDGRDGINGGALFSPTTKRECIYIHTGPQFGAKEIKFLLPDGESLHPLNQVIKGLFKLFHARYICEDYERKLKEEVQREQKKDREARQKAQLAKASHHNVRGRQWQAVPESATTTAAASSAAAPAEPEEENSSLTKPSDEMFKLRESAGDHNLFLNWLHKYDADKHWTFNDRNPSGDRLKHYVQVEHVVVSEDPSERPAKRTRSTGLMLQTGV